MSAVWGRSILKELLSKFFWGIAAIFFGGVMSWGQTKEGIWAVKIVRSPMGDRSYAVASADATENFNGERPKLVIACEVSHDGAPHGPLNVFVDLGAPLVLSSNFKDRNKPLSISSKIGRMDHIVDKWHQSESFRELHHDGTEAQQRAFVQWLSESKLFMVEFGLDGNSNKVLGFTTAGLKPYIPVMAQACGWHK